ncbi:MAG: winged helix-turn-helix transcriptional regulator [Methanobacteriota archaeon]|nr:MAG: winged helix-turn-helix transcriptional regulator [Euryarchaeota archaeon]
MDDVDRNLLLLLYENPRMHNKELEKKLGMSRQTIHHRMLALAKSGVFRIMRPGVSIHYIDGVAAAVWGRSRTSSIEETLDRLGENEFVGRVVVAGGNYLYILGCLRNASELDGYVEFAKRTAEISEPTIGLAVFSDGILSHVSGEERRQSYKRLSPLDLRIIISLRGNVRKPTAEIAEMLGVSAKTVGRHLNDMISGGSLDYDIPWDIPSGEDMLTVVHVHLKEDADKVRVARRLLSKDPIHLTYFRSFSNLPGFLLGIISSNRMSEIRKILAEIREDDDVAAITPNLVYHERLYDNWTEELPDIWLRNSMGHERLHQRSLTR